MPIPSGRKIRIGHSPDPDDAFMFYALAKGKVPLNGFEIEHVIEDIEGLNRRAFQAELEVTALSCHAFGHLLDRYQLIPYGASVGEGYGPVLVSRKAGKNSSNVKGSRIAVPGRTTTAFLILQFFESDFEPVFTPFDQIFSAVEKREVDYGLLIHEGQLTYSERGFQKVVDLGEWWAEKYQLPLPLGINAVRRDLGTQTIGDFNRLFLESIKYAMANRPQAMEYALGFGRGIDGPRGDRFVGMYVNEFSLDLGDRGRKGLNLLYRLGWERGLLPRPAAPESVFAEV